MTLVPDDLPRDPDRLLPMPQQMVEIIAQQNVIIVALRIERDTAQSRQEAAQAEIERLRLLIRQLQSGQFARRSERLDPDQLQLGLEDLEHMVSGGTKAHELARLLPWTRKAEQLAAAANA
jgi:transposase